MSRDSGAETPMLHSNHPQSIQKLWQYFATISVSLGAFCGGTVLSWTSPALSHILQDSTNSSTTTTYQEKAPGFLITDEQAGLVGSILTIGALISAIPVGYLADKFGRRVVIRSLAIPFLLNWIIIAFARNLETVLVGRFFAGVALGGICVTAPMYISEISDASSRGYFGSFFPMFLCVGILWSCVVGSFTNWVWLALVLAIIPILFGGTFFLMPETPVYLVTSNQVKQAEVVLKELRGSTVNVSEELTTIQQHIEASRNNAATLKDILTSKANLRAVVSVVGVLSFQQLSAINAVVFYTVPIFKAAGSNMSPTLAGIIINLVQVIFSYISILIIEKANRKVYLMFSSTGMMFCLTALGLYFHLKILDLKLNIDFVPLASIVLFMIAFSIGYGPVPWMLMGELLSPEIKGVASGVAVLTNWVCAFLVTFCFPIMNSSWGGHVTFYLFSGVMALATLFVYFFVPETRGKSLAEIQEALNR